MQIANRVKTSITRSVIIQKTPRALQLGGLFDVPPAAESVQTWDIDFTLPESWNVGLIVGPSGCGKSTLVNEVWAEHQAGLWPWPEDRCILDGFPASMGIKDITGLLCSVGFSSPPSWLKPFRVLSNGEQFRVTLARTLAEHPELAVVDEFTSVVDRDVAKIASAALAKAVRRREQKFIAVTCHYDVAEWLEPDWVYQPHTGEFVAGRLLRRPPIQFEIFRVHRQAWELFRKHHYLNTDLHRAAACYVAMIHDRPAAFVGVLSHPHNTHPGWREHRAVCLPDFQGVGIGNAMSEYVASLYVATGKPYYSTTSHPGMIRHRNHSACWRMLRKPSLNRGNRSRHAGRNSTGMTATVAETRYTAGFRYVGPPRREDAQQFGLLVAK